MITAFERRKGKMKQGKMIFALAVVVILGIALQGLLVFADTQDSPNKAAVEFTKAYFAFNETVLAGRLCDESRQADETDVVGKYVYKASEDAKARGYGMGFYIKDCLYNLKTETLEKTHDSAKIRLTAERRAPLRTFFSKGDKYDINSVDEVLTLVRKDGHWKVCGNPFSLASIK
jgi:hypothetical protein